MTDVTLLAQFQHCCTFTSLDADWQTRTNDHAHPKSIVETSWHASSVVACRMSVSSETALTV